jgi:protease-4
VAREIIGVENIVDFTTHPNFLNRFADRIGVTLANTMAGNFGLQGAVQQSPLH